MVGFSQCTHLASRLGVWLQWYSACLACAGALGSITRAQTKVKYTLTFFLNLLNALKNCLTQSSCSWRLFPGHYIIMSASKMSRMFIITLFTKEKLQLLCSQLIKRGVWAVEWPGVLLLGSVFCIHLCIYMYVLF